jgi:hypothetical protein
MRFKFTFVILSFFLFLQSYGQINYSDVVYLKNGSIIRGVIIEQVPNQSLKIKTLDKSVFVFKFDEIEKMTKEESESNQTVTKSKTPREFKPDTANRVNKKGHLFISFNQGYAINAARQTIGYVNNEKLVSGSFGTGLLSNLRLGYKFHKNVSLDLGFSYLYGKEITVSSQTLYYNTEAGFNQMRFKATIFNLNPAMSFHISRERAIFYIRTGLLLGIAPSLIMKLTTNNTSAIGSNSSSIETKYKYYGGIPIGFSNSLGVNFNLNHRLSFISEFNMITQNWAPNYCLVADVYKVKFADNLQTGSDLKDFMPFSSISFNLGVKINL